MEALTQLPWFQVAAFASGWSVVGYIAYLLITGRGGIALRREVAAAEKVAETFKTAWETSETAKAVLAEQVGELNIQVTGLTEYAVTADRILKAVDENRVRAELREGLRAQTEALGAEGGGS